MNFLVLVRKQLRDMRFSLGVPALAFFGLAILTTWIAMRFEKVLAEGDMSRGRGLGIVRGLGGPAQDFSTIGLEVCWWNHPFIILTIVGWSIARGSAAIAGEIDRGTLDLTLSRPVSRTTYLNAQIAASVLGLLLIVGALVAGTFVGGKIYKLESPPTISALLRPATIVFALGLSIFGYTLPFSASDYVRWRPGVISLAATLLGVIAMSLAPVFDGFEWLDRFTVFKAYAPVTIAITGQPLARNAGALACVFLAGVVPAYIVFLNRDLPPGGS
jgi:ABC-2 type transport system permease protein